MKKFLIILGIVLVSIVIPGIFLLVDEIGSGPAKISSAEEFIECIQKNEKSEIELKNDLDFSDVEWVPIEHAVSINGNGYQMANITIEADTGDNIGIFKNFSFGTIKNVKFTNLTVDYYGTGENIGGIVGYAESLELINVEVSGEINAPAAKNVGGMIGSCEELRGSSIRNKVNVIGGENVGGVVGNFIDNGGYELADLHNEGDIQALKAYAGGVIGYDNSNGLLNCTNSGNIQAKSFVGGIVGYAKYIKIENCTNSGNIAAVGLYDEELTSSYAGGIAGRAQQSNIFACTNSGSVSGEYDCVGGIAGRIGPTEQGYDDDKGGTNYSNNKNTGSVQGREHVGGVFGKCHGNESVLITNNENEGNVTGARDVAGIIGYLSFGRDYVGEVSKSEVVYCKNSGKIEATEGRVAGIIGRVNTFDAEEIATNQNTGELVGPSIQEMYHLVED